MKDFIWIAFMVLSMVLFFLFCFLLVEGAS
jgi:hypothetical protein